jgi:REP element-mobilizing transposase RayT
MDLTIKFSSKPYIFSISGFKDKLIPRVARNHSQSKYHHIVVQGVNKNYIFKNGQFMSKYKQIIIDNLKDSNVVILAYCIISNHAHFLIYSDTPGYISKFMQRINTTYATFYHKANNCIGYVFNNRFYSQDIYGCKQLYICLKYIHNNPVKAGLCRYVSDYKFSSYNSFFVLDQIITKSSISLLFKDITNYQKTFSLIYTSTELESLDFIDLKEKSFCDCLLDFETKYGKSLPDLYSDKLLLQQFIQYLRNYSNVTIREIAKELNLSKSTIANYCKK